MNITDIDDKIIRGAAAAGIGIDELADRYLERFLADADALRMTTPDVLPRATEHIDEIVELIAILLERRARLPDRRRLDLLPDRVVAGLRPARAARSRAAARRRAGRGRRIRQGRRPRLRAVEGPQARRAVVGDRRSGRAGRAGTSSARR